MIELIPSMRFNFAVGVVLGFEGGYSNLSDDPGGETNFGITRPYLNDVNPEFLKSLDIKIDSNTIKNLTLVQAKALYKFSWWDKYNYEAINSVVLASKIMDMAVNIGTIRAHMLLQSCINFIKPDTLAVDGIIGGHTLGALNACDSELLHDKLKSAAAEYYNKLIEKNPKLEIFRAGWLERAKW